LVILCCFVRSSLTYMFVPFSFVQLDMISRLSLSLISFRRIGLTFPSVVFPMRKHSSNSVLSEIPSFLKRSLICLSVSIHVSPFFSVIPSTSTFFFRSSVFALLSSDFKLTTSASSVFTFLDKSHLTDAISVFIKFARPRLVHIDAIRNFCPQ
jgi:hypothetical protein